MDQYAKEGKDKKVTFEAVFTKPNSKPKWFIRKDVSNNNYISIKIFLVYKNSETKKLFKTLYN